MENLFKKVMSGPRPPLSNPPKEKEVYFAIGVAMTICRHFEEITHDEYGDLSDWIMQQDCNYLLGFFPQED